MRKRTKLRDFQDGVVHLRGGEFQAGPDVFGFQIWKILEDLLFGLAGGEHFQHVLHSNAHSPDARAAAALLGIKGDAIQVFHRGEVKPGVN